MDDFFLFEIFLMELFVVHLRQILVSLFLHDVFHQNVRLTLLKFSSTREIIFVISMEGGIVIANRIFTLTSLIFMVCR